MKQIVECVPNFSEGRRPQVVDAILAAIMAVPGVTLLDHHSDVDHNRTVVTFVGEPEPVERAAFAAIRRAAQLIDLTQHRGGHPRIGATDVVPFVPISGVTTEDCIAMARRLGSHVGKELNIPVYLYEAAATRPSRTNLEDVRRGQYEGLKAEIETNPDRAPDFGPAKLGPAGATVIGARPFLIAFNVFLNTDDVEIAKSIAKAVRHSSGGLRYVKAMGLMVEGKAQVSMNLTDFRQTPLARVVEFVRREAAQHGASIVRTELVGLAPQAVLTDAAQWYLQLAELQPDQILENRLGEGEARLAPLAFLDATAAGAPTPGGGSVAALAGALAAALTTMVARLTVGKPRYAEVEARMRDAVAKAEQLRARLTAAIDADSVAFDAVVAARKLAQGTDRERSARQAAIQAATLHAAEVPLDVARASLQVLELAQVVVQSGSVASVTDAAVAAWMARAAVESAGLNVRINATALTDKDQARVLLEELHGLRQRAAKSADQTLATAEQRAKLP